LEALKLRSRSDTELAAKIAAATTPEPLRPTLTRPLAEAWSMTSLRMHPGRPEVQPWLRGWIEEDPQTAILWREHLPVLVRDGAAFAAAEPDRTRKEAINAFFEAAPPQTSELLETETLRVADWLIARSAALKQRVDKSGAVGIALDEPSVFALDGADEFVRWWTVQALAALDEKQHRREREKFVRDIIGLTLVVSAHLGGLNNDGLLDADWQQPASTIEATKSPELAPGGPPDSSFPRPPFTVLQTDNPAPAAQEIARFTRKIVGDEEVLWLVVERHGDEVKPGDAGAVARRAQLLDDHQQWAEREAKRLATRLGLPPPYASVLALAARLHDEGKRAERWQRAFNAPRHGGPYAKTRGPVNQKLLDGYRHEFGSLGAIERHPDVVALPEELRELLLHLVAAHHGGARPFISPKSCEDAPPSELQERVRDVALRFARLQKRWGPWGLAWWESLLRACDQLASRENDQDVGAAATRGAT
jgi:CRISPR-associated endonuclease/helicase Cas3